MNILGHIKHSEMLRFSLIEKQSSLEKTFIAQAATNYSKTGLKKLVFEATFVKLFYTKQLIFLCFNRKQRIKS
jgi:hypothetical protein